MRGSTRRALAPAVELQPFRVTQFFPEEQSLVADELRLEVFPHWLPKPTGSLRAPLASLRDTDLEGKIAYLSAEEAGEWYRVRPSDLAVDAASKGARALVVALPHPSGEIYVSNTAHPFLDAVLPIPAVVVASRNDETLLPLIGSNEVVELTSKGETQEVTAHNVLARYPAREIPGAPWIVVSTPTSGWFRCAGTQFDPSSTGPQGNDSATAIGALYQWEGCCSSPRPAHAATPPPGPGAGMGTSLNSSFSKPPFPVVSTACIIRSSFLGSPTLTKAGESWPPSSD